jgi:hypothetical protein
MEGTLGGVLAHTMNGREHQFYKINGKYIGEIDIDASIAAERGMPSIFFVGGDLACKQAKATVPEIVTVTTKKEISRNEAEFRNNDELFADIKENYNIKNYVEYSAFSTNNNYTYQYVKVFTDNIKENTTPLYSNFQVENTLYINDLNQIDIVASGFNLTDLNIIKTNTNSTIADTFNGIMSLELGTATLTIATIVSAVFLFKGLIALFRSNK